MKLLVTELIEDGRLYQGEVLLGTVSYHLRLLRDAVVSEPMRDPDEVHATTIEGAIEVDAEEALVGVELRLQLEDGRWCELKLEDTSGTVTGRLLP